MSERPPDGPDPVRTFERDLGPEEERELMHRMVESSNHVAFFAVGHDSGQIQTYYGMLSPEEEWWDDSPEMRSLLAMIVTYGQLEAQKTGNPAYFLRPDLFTKTREAPHDVDD